jgi:Luciferase-like monooxygenase
VRFSSVRSNPKPLRDRRVPVVLGGNSDAALQRVAAWGDGWYGFNLDGTAEVADRLAVLRRACREAGRDATELRCAVALREPQVGDLTALTDLGIDELVIVDSPPADPEVVPTWVCDLAEQWGGGHPMPHTTSPAPAH